MDGIRRDRINARWVSSIISRCTDLQRKSRPVNLKRFLQFPPEPCLLSSKKIVQGLRDGFNFPILHRFWYRSAEHSQLADCYISEVKDDALCGSTNHYSSGLEETGNIAFKPFCQIRHRNLI